jgi:LmbE family N-acetylglucosaminyl deacetylase
MFDALYLSPHFDDAVLSCGSQIWDRTRRGERVAVVTVCAAPPSEQLSPFAQSLHDRWRAAGEFDRKSEDLQALAVLQATPIHLAVPDCIYRRGSNGEWLYASEAAIFGEVSAAEDYLIERLVTTFRQFELKENAALFVPYALGHHVDHLLVKRAGEAWCQTVGRSFRYYADYPYAEAIPGGEEVIISDDGRRQKIQALLNYRSQLSTFWPSEADMIAKVSQWPERLF